MTALVFEVRRDGGWHELARLAPGEPAGSLEHMAPDGRQIYVFSCLAEHSVVERSIGGVDWEDGPRRIVGSMGMETVATLTPASPTTEFYLRTERMREPALVRFRHES